MRKVIPLRMTPFRMTVYRMLFRRVKLRTATPLHIFSQYESLLRPQLLRLSLYRELLPYTLTLSI